MNDDAIERLVSKLEVVVDELDDVMFDRLRAAAADRSGRPAADKRLLQARRALDKAIRTLRGTATERDDD